MPERCTRSQQEPLLESANATEMDIDIETLRSWRHVSSNLHGHTASARANSESSISEKQQIGGRTVSLLHPRTWTRKSIFIAAVVLALICIVPAIAVPMALYINASTATPSAPLANGTALRVMPLGASITFGYLSSDGNGYRQTLRRALTHRGNAINMVGSRQNGTMDDNDVEGWPGLRIEQVHAKADLSVPTLKPNVVLVNVGTNDCLQNFNISSAGDRMNALITDVLAMSPRAAFVLSTLIINADVDVDARAQTVNAAFRTLVTSLQSVGVPIVLAEMRGDNGLQLNEMADQTHPNDEGYSKMSTIFVAAIEDLSNRGSIQTSEDNGLPDAGVAAQ
ncbi:lipase, gdsl [Grosmannia clavigera kw1407]|uniref:Lipase, gdsl n=1 Tax=Grosmannia clavigera (strain kw1407 / UAMH 11150) TaxID=655863 RepID=F0X6I2_GROCL|nr:lipase, gdsl [Grosmannia clavigera kw1407]EFX06710.1 lipase, gdsl [Grosmannia clavigera kw1407]